jgi:hypothetical protein
MSWTRPADLVLQLQKLWTQGKILAGLVTGEPFFPRRLSLIGPTSSQMADQFESVRAWIRELQAMPKCRIESRAIRHRILGDNSVPAEAWIDSFDDAVALIGKRKEVSRFSALLEVTRRRQPCLQGWLGEKPLQALALADDWDRFLDIADWCLDHPRPGIYLRQVDIPGIHSKFIEAHRGQLIELLDRLLPPETIDFSATGVGRFAERYGFRDKPPRLRFRILDPELLSSFPGQDMALTGDDFARLDPPIRKVFITENEINFLAFPEIEDSLILFGAGYGFETLKPARWLSRCRVHYWGDIDTHGFGILDQLRHQFDHVLSFLMDRTTLLAFESHWGFEEKPTLRDMPRLTPSEQALYDDLRDNRLGRNIRLEQERIGFGWVESALATIA